jgi:phosphonate transport system substrate-binding protein
VQALNGVDQFRIGFTRSIFKNRNEGDILAAMGVWARTITRERGIQVNPDMLVYDSLAEAVDNVRTKQVEAITLSLAEYSSFPADLLCGPYFRHETHGGTHVEFVLLGQKGSRGVQMEDLRGATLIAHDGTDLPLGVDWLDAHLMMSGLGPLSNFFSRVDRSSKLSSAVLRVFFGKNEACLVMREGFESMAELNPQVSKQLTVIRASPRIIPSLFSFRSTLSEADKQLLFREILRLHESVTGEQVLRIFKSSRMAEVDGEELRRSLGLLKSWRTETGGRQAAQLGGLE